MDVKRSIVRPGTLLQGRFERDSGRNILGARNRCIQIGRELLNI